MIRLAPFRTLLLTSLIAISACKTGGGGGITTDDGASLRTAPDTGSGSGSGAEDAAGLLGGWFVTSFDKGAVRAVRESAAFLAQDLQYRLTVKDHSKLDGSRTISSNALREIGVDYARSVGLTGKGVKIAVIDSGIQAGHEAFAGKTVEVAAGSPAGHNFHGTGVAGVAAGAGGVAPDAGIFSGVIDFHASADFRHYASLAEQARAAGALVMNNSWMFGGSIQDDAVLRSVAGRDYVSALTDYARDGIVVFAASNGHADQAAHLMAALPALHPHLENSWLTVINAIPTLEGDEVTSAIRVSAACLEAAAWCLAANGQILMPTNEGGPDQHRYAIGTGASFAAPQVAGSLALLAEAFPTLSPEQLRARLLVTADNEFFEAEGHVDFGSGLRHGYNSEFGHGFVDLKAALLPIGNVGMVAASGARHQLKDIVLVSRGASGDAIAAALSSEALLVADQMEGDFEIPASGIATVAGASARSGVSARLSRLDASAILIARHSALNGDGGSALGPPERLALPGSHSIGEAVTLPVAAGDDYRIEAILAEDGSGSLGIAGVRSLHVGLTGIEFSVKALREQGAILGLSGSRRGATSEHVALTLAAALPLTDGAVLRFDGSFGEASGGRISEVAEIGSQTFNSLGASISTRDAAVAGDVLTIFARQPVAVRSGSAEIEIARPMRTATGGVDYRPLSVDLAPRERQVDVGLEYMRPLGRFGGVAMVLRHAENARNVAGARETEIGLSFSTRF